MLDIFTKTWEQMGHPTIASLDISRFESNNHQAIKQALADEVLRRMRTDPRYSKLINPNEDSGIWWQLIVGHKDAVLKGRTFSRIGKLVVCNSSTTASGEPLWTVWNSVFNLLWTGMQILAWTFERTGKYSNPFDLFSRQRGGKRGTMEWRQLTVYF